MAPAAQSPFVDTASFEAAGAGVPRRVGPASPFVEAFVPEVAFSNGDRSSAARHLLAAELYDEELDEATYELIEEASAHLGDTGAGPLAASALRVHFDPLASELERMIDEASAALAPRDVLSLAESEVDDVLSRIQPERALEPAFENFFNKIKNAVKRVAKGAATLAKKGIAVAAQFGLGPLMGQLHKLVRPLLERVLKAAINRLPPAVRPLASKLAGKLPALFQSEVEENAEDPAADAGDIQREFNDQIVEALLGAPGNGAPAPWSHESRSTIEAAASIGDLDTARARFADEISRLDDGADPSPAVERFIPAILPALKLGIRIAGRKRVVGLLSGLVSKLISRFVGPASATALSTALVDAGMNLMGLEVSEQDRLSTAQSALAATVEETVRQVSALPDAVLDNEALLEHAVVSAFERAAASNLPPVLPDRVYRRRPDLVETSASARGAWVPLPLRGAKRYKKFSRVIGARITPHVAKAVTTFGGAPLSEFLEEQLGIEPGEDVQAEVHLFETMPGTLLGEVSRLEANGQGAAASAEEFHPLTPEAAALLVGEAGLGRRGASATGVSRPALAVGQRFYRLAIPGRRPVLASAGSGSRRTRRRTSVHTVLDFPRDRIVLYLYLSERRAQQAAAQLGRPGQAAAVATLLRGFIDRGLATAIDGHVGGRIRIVHEAVPPAQARGAALERLPRAAVHGLAARLGEWTLTALSDHLTSRGAGFISATQDAQDGVTLVVTLSNPPGLAAMRSALGGGTPGTGSRAEGKPNAEVRVVPGFTNG